MTYLDLYLFQVKDIPYFQTKNIHDDRGARVFAHDVGGNAWFLFSLY